ncbi:MAG: hypothetical protein VX438_17290, partial [Planctomycetota bacterium]|nr:hypothetical protein [Planctomycetota bacterium]
ESNTGKEKWSVPGLTRSSLLFVDEHFVCLTETGRLFVFKANPEKLEFVSQIRLDLPMATPDGKTETLLSYPCWAAPILSHGLLYVRGPDFLICLELIEE